MFRKPITKLTSRIASMLMALLLLGLQTALPTSAAAWSSQECEDWANTHTYDSEDWPRDCKGSIKVNKKVDADGNGVYEGGNTAANQLGFKWGHDSNTPSRNMGTTASDILTGSHTVNENSVAGFTFTGWYFTQDEDRSCGNPEGKTLPISLTVKKEKTSEITLCNQKLTSSITIIKDAQPNSLQDFRFYRDWGPENQRTLILDDDASVSGGNNSHSNTKVFSNLDAGNYTINELNTAGWALQNIVCSEGANIEKDDQEVKIKLAAGQNVTCTFINQQRGRVYVTKVTEPNDTTTQFGLNIDGKGNITGSLNKDIVGGQTISWEVDQGTYNVTENTPDGWTQKSNDCQDLYVTANNLNVYCTITNVKTAKLTIVKDARPDSDKEFYYTSDELGEFTLVDDGSDESNSKTFYGLTAGEYWITELEADNWELKDIDCEGTEDWDDHGSKLEVDLVAGDDVTCTFTNKKLGTIKGYKFNDKDSNGVRDEDEQGLKNWHITLYDCKSDQDDDRLSFLDYVPQNTLQTLTNCNEEVADDWTNNSGKYKFDNLEKGTYKVCEQQKDHWTQTLPASYDGCYEITINEAGQVETADFGNHHNISLVVAKSNDKPNAVVAGDTVTYTVKVSVPEDSDTVYDATAVDLLPSGFTYVGDSWTANSSVRGDIKDAPTTEPPYGTGSEGVWTLGTMVSGEVVTLTYQVKIATTVTPGTYANAVFAKGFDNPRCGDISEEVDQEYARYEYDECDKACSDVTSPFATSAVTVAAVLGESTFTPGQVLGASTLVNTGATLQPMQLILPILMLLGTAYLTIATRKTSKLGAK